MCRVATVQALLLNLVMQRSFHERRAYKKTFCHLFSQSPDIYKMYIEELKDARIPYKDSSELIWLLLEYSSTSSKSSSLYEQCKPTFLDIYLKAILNAREKPARGLSEAFHPLFKHMLHEDFQNIVLPSAVKMLKCNPEIVLESVGILLKSVNLDLSKYAVEILSVVLPQAQHADEGRRVVALAVIRCLSQKSSNPDALEAMFNAVKSVIGGSEGRLTLPYQRIGMINTLQEMCNAPDGNEEVKLAILSALGSWAARSADAVQSNLVLFFSSGIKEKEISSLLEPLIQLVKTGFTKAAQRLDGIYALLLVGKITAIDIKAEEIVVKDKIWSLISQNEPSLASKLSTEDCMACVDLLEVMLVEHLQMVQDSFSVRLLSQLMIFFICHPCWEVRRMNYDATRRIVSAAPQLTEPLLVEFTNFTSVVAGKLRISKLRYNAFLYMPLIPFNSSHWALPAAPSAATRVLLCAHHPYLVGTARRDVVWKRLQRCMHACGFDIISNILADVENLFKGLLVPMLLSSTNPYEQQAAVSSLFSLMSFAPGETYVEFEKHLKNLPYRFSLDTLSENDIQIFHTPEGLLSSEQGVYTAESVDAKNMKQAKGRFRMHEDLDDMDHGGSNHSSKVERTNNSVGKRETGKSAKKPDKGMTAKEEACEVQLREEASICDKVREIQKNLTSILAALGEMAIANPIFAHSQLTQAGPPATYEIPKLAKEAAETVVLVIDEEGVESLISELVRAVSDSQLLSCFTNNPSIRRSSSYLIGYFFKNCKLYLVDEAPNVISTLIVLLSDSDSATVVVSWEALSRVVSSVPKEVLPSYIKLVRDAVSTSRDKERRKKKGGSIVIPGFCLPKALQPLLPIFHQIQLTLFVFNDLGQYCNVTEPDICGMLTFHKSYWLLLDCNCRPLIRIIGDRFPWQVKSAILSTLTIMIRKGGVALKPFLPQLQTTFYLEDVQLTELLQELSDFLPSRSLSARHGYAQPFHCLSPEFLSILDRLKGALIDEKLPLRETSTKAFGRLLIHKLRSDPSNTSLHLEIISSLVSALRNDSSEVRRKALSAIKRGSKDFMHGKLYYREMLRLFLARINIIGPALAECLKDGSTPMRLAAERCALHAFQLSKGPENVQAAQKFITGLDARRISKLPENSPCSGFSHWFELLTTSRNCGDDSEDGEDTASG
ncbi:translational activator GCN1 [Pyrus ussuriensis x Pyrus communis]|uniref:Translational activator GCN1 n=1 Tax=Pyrus ussuriensis x Pyrus communis TaxID=2448454 RepID=A0A5N5HDY2_9ROSA|nr:translational activator GCN1 [Pyrus ussuriensis x Pyrus communis]